MDALFAAYTDPLFVWFPLVTSAISMGAFLTFAVPLTWLAWTDPPWFARYRIQSRRGRADRIIGPSLRWWLLDNALMTALVVIAWPLLRTSGVHLGPAPPWWEVAGSVVAFVYLDDFLYYWMHRAFHTPWLYAKVHRVHHLLTTPWAIGAHYMHPVEFIATGSLALLGPILLDSHVVTVWVWIVWRQWEAAEGHCGYAFPFNPGHLFPGYGGTVFHDLHHAKFKGNYSGFLGWFDRVAGTYLPSDPKLERPS
jgi:4-alpha-methyl-delta7-sterol-4alpha-methyl oxidase